MRAVLIVLTMVVALGCAEVVQAQAARPSAPATPPGSDRPPATPSGQERTVPSRGVAPSAPTGGIEGPAYLKITLDASRSPIAMDTEAGLSAEIKNVSRVPVRLFENETIFITTPETRIYGDGPHVILGCATFPTQGNVRPAERPARGYELLMQPGDSYRVFWDMSVNGCTGQRQAKRRFWNGPLAWAEEKWQRIAFRPGTYKIYIDVLFYPEDQPVYRSMTEMREAQVSASQQMILLGAFLGGVLAYVIKLYYGVDTTLKIRMENPLLRRILGYTEWLSAGIFGAGMAILASRLSDAFPVKISADDFWGAITLGFVFQWVGVKLLEKLPGMGPSRNPPTPKPAGE
jgi:hypothetical protein